MPVGAACTGLHETLALLTSQLHPDANHDQDLLFLKDVFSERSLAYLMKIHDKLKLYEKHSPAPVLHSASCLAEDARDDKEGRGLVHVGDELREGSITLKIIPATTEEDKLKESRVVSQDDAIWWQAKKVGDCNLRAASSRSTQFQER
ncbi:hypothetical protein CRUP_022833 [Coryphaenoides rupestris]|nr:hypothetical protein CRUP_022833 [Coryphaenoides rupestris]